MSSIVIGPYLKPFLAFHKKCGAFDILSNPPEITTSDNPNKIFVAPSVVAFNPEAQTLLTFQQGIK